MKRQNQKIKNVLVTAAFTTSLFVTACAKHPMGERFAIDGSVSSGQHLNLNNSRYVSRDQYYADASPLPVDASVDTNIDTTPVTVSTPIESTTATMQLGL